MALRDGALGSTVRQFKIRVLTLAPRSCVNIDNYLTSLGLCEIKQNLLLNHRRRQWHPTPVLCLENPMDGGAWWAAVHGVAKSRTRLSNFPFTFHFHALEKEMATHFSVLAWRVPGTGEPGGCRLWDHTESDTTEVTLQQQQYSSTTGLLRYLGPLARCMAQSSDVRVKLLPSWRGRGKPYRQGAT